MKRSELKQSIREEIIDILEEATDAEVKNAKELNKELTITKKLTADVAKAKQEAGMANEGNDRDYRDDGYVNKKDVDDTTDLYVHNDPESMAFEQVEDDEMDKQATAAAKKGDSVSKIASKLQQTTKEMKQVVKKWKTSEGAEKEELKNRLRELTKIKKELEGLL